MANQENKPRTIGQLAGWLLLAAFCAAIVAWGVAVFRIVPDTPRQWDFGALPDAPSQSIYSSDATPPTAGTQRQLPMLPEAKVRQGGTPTGAKAFKEAASLPATAPATRPAGGTR